MLEAGRDLRVGSNTCFSKWSMLVTVVDWPSRDNFKRLSIRAKSAFTDRRDVVEVIRAASSSNVTDVADFPSKPHAT